MKSNYSFFEKYLHKATLDSKILNNLLFDLEKFFFLINENFENNCFIFGLARSGTTTALNYIYNTNEYASPLYKDMPFILSCNLWSKFKIRKKIKTKKRFHDDGIFIDLESPEAFEEIFWKFIKNNNYIVNDKLNTHEVNNYEINEFQKFINLICIKNHKKKYISKNNNNFLRINSLSNFFSKSKFIFLFRDPINQSYSSLNLHKKTFLEQKNDNFIQKYMNGLGHHEFGLNFKPFGILNFSYNKDDLVDINFWLKYWICVHEYIMKLQLKKNVYFLSYENFCKDPSVILKKILNIKNSDMNFNISNKNKSLNIQNDIFIEAKNLYNKLLSKSL